jgi:hypothetical protein
MPAGDRIVQISGSIGVAFVDAHSELLIGLGHCGQSLDRLVRGAAVGE